MGIKERRENERENMKKKIMKEAIKLIEKDGYEQLSIRKLAAKIQYSPTTIYIYYKDKAEIITDMANEIYDKTFQGVSIWLEKNGDLSVEKQVKGSMKVFINCLCSEPEMVKAIMFSGQNVIYTNDGLDGKPSNKGIEMLDLLLLEGIGKNIFRESIRGNSWMVISGLFGFASSVIINNLNCREDFQVFVDDFVDILVGGILVEESK